MIEDFLLFAAKLRDRFVQDGLVYFLEAPTKSPVLLNVFVSVSGRHVHGCLF